MTQGTDVDVFVVGGVGMDVIVEVNELPPPLADAAMVPPIRSYVGHTGKVRGRPHVSTPRRAGSL